ncbi:uncharacterized protein N7511_008409 [Penicillium nucicola]|uniref:uncharacterized protein n=1 Tax=Penicillium nucicola TaxID=1850975 RepID=UPI00254559C0|nr:uncharacterized protein N7511_008409 [Penicillium nucicola]KAJ5751444.1 hypothetical protein N7511_008409 [Penicillium nucicola]
MVYGHDNDNFYQYNSGTNLFPYDEWTAEPTFGLDDDTPTIPRFGEVSSTSEAKQVYIHAYFFYYHKINPFIHEETFKLHLSTQCLPETEEESCIVSMGQMHNLLLPDAHDPPIVLSGTSDRDRALPYSVITHGKRTYRLHKSRCQPLGLRLDPLPDTADRAS